MTICFHSGSESTAYSDPRTGNQSPCPPPALPRIFQRCSHTHTHTHSKPEELSWEALCWGGRAQQLTPQYKIHCSLEKRKSGKLEENWPSRGLRQAALQKQLPPTLWRHIFFFLLFGKRAFKKSDLLLPNRIKFLTEAFSSNPSTTF